MNDDYENEVITAYESAILKLKSDREFYRAALKRVEEESMDPAVCYLAHKALEIGEVEI